MPTEQKESRLCPHDYPRQTLNAVVLNSATEVINDSREIVADFKLHTINGPSFLLAQEADGVALQQDTIEPGEYLRVGHQVVTRG